MERSRRAAMSLVLPPLGGVVTAAPPFLLGIRGTGLSVAFYAGLLATTLALATQIYSLRSCGLTGRVEPSHLGWPALFVALRMVPWVAFVHVLGVRPPGFAVVLGLLYFVFATALAEEAFFRGLLYRAALDAWGRAGVAVLATSVVFALGHLSAAGLLFLPVFVADGVALCAVRIRTGTVYAAVLGHGLLDFLTADLLISRRAVDDASAVGYVLAVVVLDAVVAATCLRAMQTRRRAAEVTA